MDNVLQKSEAVEMRKGGDAIKSLAIGEDELAKMPMAEQPEQLKAQLLPYQLQVCLFLDEKRFTDLVIAGPCVDDLQGKPSAPRERFQRASAALAS
jgi:SWI/SNF-related matrix-associated actin-dependent regulator of chromatin subfamily A3